MIMDRSFGSSAIVPMIACVLWRKGSETSQSIGSHESGDNSYKQGGKPLRNKFHTFTIPLEFMEQISTLTTSNIQLIRNLFHELWR